MLANKQMTLTSVLIDSTLTNEFQRVTRAWAMRRVLNYLTRTGRLSSFNPMDVNDVAGDMMLAMMSHPHDVVCIIDDIGQKHTKTLSVMRGIIARAMMDNDGDTVASLRATYDDIARDTIHMTINVPRDIERTFNTMIDHVYDRHRYTDSDGKQHDIVYTSVYELSDVLPNTRPVDVDASLIMDDIHGVLSDTPHGGEMIKIVNYLADGYTLTEIAESMGVTWQIVDRRVATIRRVLSKIVK